MSAAGLLLVDKPSGPTSHDIVGWVRWVLQTKQVGHCGTLDPAATGLLVVCVGAATKLSGILTGTDKTYRAQFVLGRSTTTDDAQGQTLSSAPVDPATAARAGAVLGAMVGELSLVPPAFCAVHTEGTRAHVLARAGKPVTLAARAMTLLDARDVVLDRGCVHATVHVSKGTYVRSLALELGARLGVPAHLGALRRLGAGSHHVDAPQTVGPLHAVELAPRRWRVRPEGGQDRAAQAEFLTARLLPAWTGLPIAVLHLPPSTAQGAALATRLGHGQAIALDDPAWLGAPPCGETAVVVAPGAATRAVVILVDVVEGCVRPRRVVALA